MRQFSATSVCCAVLLSRPEVNRPLAMPSTATRRANGKGVGPPKLDATLLLPLSYAVSRPLLTYLDTGVAPVLLFGAALFHFVEHVLQGLAHPDEGPDALVCGLSLCFQLAGSASVWLLAETMVLHGSVHLPTTSASRETTFGVVALCGTALAFILPRLPRARQLYRVLLALATHYLRLLLLSMYHVMDTVAPLDGGTYASPQHASPSGPHALYDATEYSPRTPGNAMTPPDARLSLGGGGGGELVGRHEEPSRRELFGVRRRIKAAFFRAAGSLAEEDEDEDEDDIVTPQRGTGGGAGAERSRRSIHTRGSIVANTEAMTQLALAAKNDELERISAARADLIRGVAEVLAVLTAATQAQAHESNGEKGGGGASASVGKGGGGASLSSSHRSLLNAALHAQAWLQSLLLSHDPQMLNENGQVRPERRGSAPTSTRYSTARADDGPGRAPSGHAVGMAAASRGLPGSLAGASQDLLDERSGCSVSAELTWTSALGVQDVHQRLYEDANSASSHSPRLRAA